LKNTNSDAEMAAALQGPPTSPLGALVVASPTADENTRLSLAADLEKAAAVAAASASGMVEDVVQAFAMPDEAALPPRTVSTTALFARSNPTSPKRSSLPNSGVSSPVQMTPNTSANFLQTIFDAASRMVGAPKQVNGVDRRDLPPLPSSFHESDAGAPNAQSNGQVHHQLPSKLIIAPAKNVVAPSVGAMSPPVKSEPQPVQLTIAPAAAQEAGGVTPIVLSDGSVTESPTSENFVSPSDDSRLSPSKAAERQRRRRRNPNTKSPISPGPPPELEIDTPTTVRTKQEELEARLDGNVEGVQEAGVEVAVSPQDGVVLRWQSGDDLFLLSDDKAKEEEANLPPLPSPLPPLTTPILWTIRQQQGYRKPPGHPMNVPSLQRQPLHAKCEDVHGPSLPAEPTYSDAAMGVHPINHNAYHLFVLADGHGGHGCAEWFVPRIRDQVEELLRKDDWEFSVEGQRCKFGEHITSIFADLDREYCDMKVILLCIN
jgi:hypothetical protein